VGFAQLVILARIEQDTLGSGCFTGIDMGHNANISCETKIGHSIKVDKKETWDKK
jgi:hypothetical protein